MARERATGATCPECGKWILFQKNLEGMPVAIEGRPATRGQLITALIGHQPAFKRIDIPGGFDSWFAPADVRTLARKLHLGVALKDIGFDVHLVHPCKVRTSLIKVHNASERATAQPTEPPF